jgi:hypothetical protein
MNTKKGNYSGLIIGGGIVGAIIGVVAALIMIKSSEQADVTPQLNAKKGLQLGLGVVSLLRSLSIITRGE